jgi:hypothetical protein
MSYPTGRKRKVDDAGSEDEGRRSSRQKISHADMNEILGAVANFVQQQYEENAPIFLGISPEINGWTTEQIECYIQPELDDEAGLTGSSASLEFDPTEPPETSRREASPEDEDVVMGSYPFGQDDYAAASDDEQFEEMPAEQPSFTDGVTNLDSGLTEALETSLEALDDFVNSAQAAITTTTTTFTGGAVQEDEDGVEFVIDEAYIADTAAQSVSEVWEELLLAVADFSGVAQFRDNTEVKETYSNYLQEVADYISILLNEENEDDTWTPRT